MTARTQTPGRRPPDASAIAHAAHGRFAADVHYYLAQEPPQLPSRYLYDALGSALFEAICRLPWYPITRAELELLKAHAPDIFARLDPLATIIELGSGSGDKLVALLSARRAHTAPLDVHLIDVSPDALNASGIALGGADGLSLTLHEASYEDGLAAIASLPRGEDRALAAFLGSNIGNFDPPGARAFLRNVRSTLRPGDGFLLGVDLVKPEAEMLMAYDDPLGVTAAFNRNLLVRINRELDGDFDLTAFDHRAVWNESSSRIEMHLVARCKQIVHIGGAGFELRLRAGESIWTESSYKYRSQDVLALLTSAAFGRPLQWIDQARGFALTLVEAV